MKRFTVIKNAGWLGGRVWEFNAESVKLDEAGNAVFYGRKDEILHIFHPQQWDNITSGRFLLEGDDDDIQ